MPKNDLLERGGGKMSRFTILDVAETFLSIESMTHKKLQKLCYYSQGWHLALEKERLFDSRFEAWIHGPVCPELYARYRDSGWVAIQQCTMPEVIEKNDEVKEFLGDIYRIYGDLDGDQLESLSHDEEPWKAARVGLEPWQSSNNVIDEEIMRRFYLEEYERSQND